MMLVFGNSNPWVVMKLWSFMTISASLMHGFVGLNAGHHHETIFHDGDDLKSTDFGVYQLSATIDRNDVGDSLFLTLTNFGNHTLHHLFPTLDHAILPQLHETLISTCVEFECELRQFPWWKLIAGQFKQLMRTESKRFS
jgi:fatty acid desaturase